MDRDLFEQLHKWLLDLPSVKEAPHRFGGTEFQVDGLEFMHSHGPTFLDIRLSKQDQMWALKEGGAIRHRWAPQAGWVSFRLKTEVDLELAKKIILLSYGNAKESMEFHASRRACNRQEIHWVAAMTKRKRGGNKQGPLEVSYEVGGH